MICYSKGDMYLFLIGVLVLILFCSGVGGMFVLQITTPADIPDHDPFPEEMDFWVQVLGVSIFANIFIIFNVIKRCIGGISKNPQQINPFDNWFFFVPIVILVLIQAIILPILYFNYIDYGIIYPWTYEAVSYVGCGGILLGILFDAGYSANYLINNKLEF